MSQTPLTAWVDGVGFLAPGMPDWPTACAILRGEQAYTPAPSVLPVPNVLPPAERRRASRVVKLALALGLEAAAHAETDVGTLATVFTASGADGHNCHALCEQLATDDRRISPTRFHNSVHNAAAGYWGIATGAMAPCQVLCAFDASFGAGLLDALAQVVVDRWATLLIAYDSEYPEPLHRKRPIPDCAGVALLLTPLQSVRSLARIAVTPGTDAAARLADGELESLRT
ncbi:beta-ketoacyl synthase chain length factor, partial [Candidatus Accumulibacter vicinus]|uniref:beta-ketoacyl synthase chain length factor n=1 Tax=Candidatus Accumulibacter vicinus TaxID=2954382 RepID=UPI000550C839